MTAKGTELCFGFVLLLEAAEFGASNLVTPPFHKKRDQPPPLCQVKPTYFRSVSSSLSPNKRIKLSFGDASCSSSLHANHVSRSSTSTIEFSPIKKSSKCSGGSAHRVWERADESVVAAASARRFNLSRSTEANEGRNVVEEHTNNADEKAFVLYDKDDDKHINSVHNIVRRDIWEGFVVDARRIIENEDHEETPSNARRVGRLARYDGTIGFRCRFCKDAPLSKQAERSAVYPRCLEKIYLANIRFQRDHIQQCEFIPSEVKENYSRLKNGKCVTRGRKQYWVSSAIRRGLRNGDNGIVFSSESK